MNRKTLFGRVAGLMTAGKNTVERMEYATVRLEPLEDRKMLTTSPVYVNDNWTNLDGPTLELGDQVTSAASDGLVVVAEYGFDGFGTVGGSSIAGAALIFDAIQNTNSGGTLTILGGTYTESDIIIDRPMTLRGMGMSGATETVLRPEVASADVQENFGVGTRSAIIIYSPTVNVSDLRIDGSANGALGGTHQYHHGITTLYDSQNGGDYSSLRNGTLPQIILGTPGGGEDGHLNASVPSLDIRNVSVNNVYWHGITISPLFNRNFDTGQEENFNLQVRFSEINNVGDVKDANRIGLLLHNLNDEFETADEAGNAMELTISNVGVGVRTAPYGDNIVWGNSNRASNQSYVDFVTVIDPAIRGFEIIDGSRTDASGWHVQVTNPVNNVVGIYENNSRSYFTGAEITGAKIGVQIQNSALSRAGLSEKHAIFGFENKLVGPGIGVAGSAGVLINNESGDTESANSILGIANISGYETGVRIEQTATPTSGLKNILIALGGTVTGNGTGFLVGNNSVISGSLATSSNVTISGNGTIDPRMFEWDAENPYYQENPGNVAGILPDPNADENSTGNITLGSSSTYSALLTGETGSAMLFDYNNQATYGFSAPPDDPVDGVVPQPYGALFGWFLKVTQSGNPDGEGNETVEIANGINGYQYEFMFGTNNVPITTGPNAGKFQLVGTDISNESHLNMKVKLRPENTSTVFGFGLIDFRGNANFWTIDTTKLSSLSYTTVTFNMLTPTIDLTGPDSDLDLTNIAGWVYGGDQGVANGLNTVPVGFMVDEITRTSVPNSKINVTGSVNLGGSNLDINLGPGFTPSVSQTFTIVNNDAADAVAGTFNGFAENATVVVGSNQWKVNYGAGDGNDVVLTFLGTVPNNSTIEDRHIFYNQSVWDGNSALISPVNDNAAIATDKDAYLPNATTAIYNNITSYSRGINGIMVDLSAGVTHTGITAGDFVFKVGNNNTPGSWAAAPAPSALSVVPGGGVGGSDRVIITWPLGVIKNQWLEVQVLATANTGLAAPDVHFWGNKIADSGTATPAGTFSTTTADSIQIFSFLGGGKPITDIRDYNRDGSVSTTDSLIVFSNLGSIVRLNVGPGGPFAPEAEPAVDDGSSAVASALAAGPKGVPGEPKVPGWITSRLASVDLNSGKVAELFTKLAEVNTPGTRSLLLAANEFTDSLDLDDSLLESLIAGLE